MCHGEPVLLLPLLLLPPLLLLYLYRCKALNIGAGKRCQSLGQF